MTHALRAGRRARLLLVAILGAMLVAPVVPAAAGAPTLQTRWARYDFSGTGNGVLDVAGSFRGGPGAFFGSVIVDNAHSAHPDAWAADVLDLDGSTDVRSYGALGNHDLCVGPVTCRSTASGFGFGVSFTVQGGGPRQDIRLYLVMRGTDVHIHDLAMIGWRARHTASGVLRRTDVDATGAGVAFAGEDAGATVSVGAPGFTAGSVAIGVPECDVVGAGAMTLTGGQGVVPAVCPSEPVSDVARGKTQWSFSGATAGVSEDSTRLLVIRS